MSLLMRDLLILILICLSPLPPLHGCSIGVWMVHPIGILPPQHLLPVPLCVGQCTGWRRCSIEATTIWPVGIQEMLRVLSQECGFVLFRQARESQDLPSEYCRILNQTSHTSSFICRFFRTYHTTPAIPIRARAPAVTPSPTAIFWVSVVGCFSYGRLPGVATETLPKTVYAAVGSAGPGLMVGAG